MLTDVNGCKQVSKLVNKYLLCLHDKRGTAVYLRLEISEISRNSTTGS